LSEYFLCHSTVLYKWIKEIYTARLGATKVVARHGPANQAIMPGDSPLTEILNRGCSDCLEEILARTLIGYAERTGEFAVNAVPLSCLAK
jgi:hypothetical protein